MSQSLLQISAPDRLAAVTQKLLRYCQGHDWAGYEPSDATNSPYFNKIPLLDSYLPRLALTQFLKRSPVNLRSTLRITASSGRLQSGPRI